MIFYNGNGVEITISDTGLSEVNNLKGKRDKSP